MVDRMLSLIVLVSFPFVIWAKTPTCLKSATTCEECIQSGPDCGWCMDPKSAPFCDTAEMLHSGLCSQVYDPRGDLLILRNHQADGRSFFLAPQEFSITLRPGVSQTFHLTLSTSSDQPDNEPVLETTTAPEAFNITLKKILNGNPSIFEVTLKADKCPSKDLNQSQNETGPWSVHIKPMGISQVTKLNVSVECNCDCLNKPEPRSPQCNNRGTRVCGLCLCQEPYSGDTCRTNDDYCRPKPQDPVCSGRGICDNNFCVCNKHQDNSQNYFGQYCECSNSDCPWFNGRLCGGRGSCECGQCVCDEGWTGDACACTMDSAPCMADNQMICNGHGFCECGVCRCEPPFHGPTCESCPTCESRCQKHMRCAECRVFETVRCDNECRELTVNLVDVIEDVPTTPLCKMMSRKDSCFIYFSYAGSSTNGQLTVAKTKECPRPMYQ